jgi:acid phosphatase
MSSLQNERHCLSFLGFLSASVLLALHGSVAAAEPPNLGDLKAQLIAYHDYGAYERDLDAVGRQALSYLVSRSGQVKNPAIVIDIDETALSNWEQIVADDFGFLDQISCDVLPERACDVSGYKVVPSTPGGKCEVVGCKVVACDSLPKGSCNHHSGAYKLVPCQHLPKGPCGFQEYDKLERATAIPPTLALARAARAHNVAIFFITGRHEVERSVTEANLKAAGYDWDKVYMRPDGTSTESSADYKKPIRAQIEDTDHYTIIVNIGDQASDLAGGHAERGFLLPNPFYRIP